MSVLDMLETPIFLDSERPLHDSLFSSGLRGLHKGIDMIVALAPPNTPPS